MHSEFLSFNQSNLLHYILLKPMGCDGLLGSDKRMDKCERCGATEGVCLHVPCNIKEVDEQENGMYINNDTIKLNGYPL